VCVDAQKFKEAFENAKKFNKLLKEGKTEELVMAPAVEDVEEVAEDDPDQNRPADQDADGAGDE
jgi:hypothetical protein